MKVRRAAARKRRQRTGTLMTFDDARRAIKTANLLSIRLALDGGMSPNLSNKFSWTLLMIAAVVGNTKIGELLIERGANPDKMNDFGETAFSLAAHAGHMPFVELLLTKGASTECQPRGHSLGDWVTNTSGPPPDKIAAILATIEKHRRRNGRRLTR